MLGRTSPSEFAALPLDTQLERLRAALSVEDPRQLLLLCAGLRDFAPLGFLCERLFLDGFFRDPASREFFAGFLVAQSEMAVHRVLRALADRLAAARGPEAAARADAEPLCATLLLSLARAPLDRLTSMCLIDRALKHHFPLERDRAIDALCARAAERIESGQNRLQRLQWAAGQRLEQAARQLRHPISVAPPRAAAVAIIYPQLPPLDELTHYQPRQPLQVFTADGVEIAQFGSERRQFVPIERMPRRLQDAVLANVLGQLLQLGRRELGARVVRIFTERGQRHE